MTGRKNSFTNGLPSGVEELSQLVLMCLGRKSSIKSQKFKWVGLAWILEVEMVVWLRVIKTLGKLESTFILKKNVILIVTQIEQPTILFFKQMFLKY